MLGYLVNLALMLSVCVWLQSVLLVNVIYFVWLCHLTLPLYSLVVHMGCDIKHEALPAQLRERLQHARDSFSQVSPALLTFSCGMHHWQHMTLM